MDITYGYSTTPSPSVVIKKHLQITGIQFLRFIAVFLVVGTHAVQEVWRRIGSDSRFDFLHAVGGDGVDIFFVISGFVITISTIKAAEIGGASAAWLFCKRRIIRIVPMYWFYTAVKALLIVSVGSKAFSGGVSPGFLLSSLFFLPTINPAGEQLPLLESGWTLSYEMLFYASFALAVLWRRPPLRFSLILLGAVFLAGYFLNGIPFLHFFSRSILFEFLLGGMIARLWVRQVTLPAFLPPAMFIIAVLCLFVIPMPSGGDRLLKVGLPCVLLVMSMVWLERYYWISRLAGYFKLLGDASYSIYLSHGLVIPACVILAMKMNLHQTFLIFGFAVVGAMVFGSVLYLLLEKPCTDWLNRKFTGKKQ